MTQKRRRRRVRVTDELVREGFFGNPNNFVVEGLPDDSEYINMYRDDAKQCVFFIFENEEWEPVEEGEVIPEISSEISIRPKKCTFCEDSKMVYDRESDSYYCPLCEVGWQE